MGTIRAAQRPMLTMPPKMTAPQSTTSAMPVAHVGTPALSSRALAAWFDWNMHANPSPASAMVTA